MTALYSIQYMYSIVWLYSVHSIVLMLTVWTHDLIARKKCYWLIDCACMRARSRSISSYCGVWLVAMRTLQQIAKQESPADAVKPARRKSMQKLLQFDVFRFISPNSISPNCQCIASRGGPMFSQALGLYNCTQFEIRCLPIIKFLV